MIKGQKRQADYFRDRILEVVSGTSVDVDLLAFYTGELIEILSRLKAAKEDVKDYQKALESIYDYRKVILERYFNEFDFSIPEMIIDAALHLKVNLSLFSKENLDEDELDLIFEIEEDIFDLLLTRESTELIYAGFKALFPKVDFSVAENHIQHIDNALKNIYYTPGIKAKVLEYVKNSPMAKTFKFFFRPSIDKMPELLQCEIEENEAVRMVAEIEKCN